jgi:hypothetical protein
MSSSERLDQALDTPSSRLLAKLGESLAVAHLAHHRDVGRHAEEAGDQPPQVDGGPVGPCRPGLHVRHVGDRYIGLEDLFGSVATGYRRARRERRGPRRYGVGAFLVPADRWPRGGVPPSPGRLRLALGCVGAGYLLSTAGISKRFRSTCVVNRRPMLTSLASSGGEPACAPTLPSLPTWSRTRWKSVVMRRCSSIFSRRGVRALSRWSPRRPVLHIGDKSAASRCDGGHLRSRPRMSRSPRGTGSLVHRTTDSSGTGTHRRSPRPRSSHGA